jgi:hypothetical protein
VEGGAAKRGPGRPQTQPSILAKHLQRAQLLRGAKEGGLVGSSTQEGGVIGDGGKVGSKRRALIDGPARKRRKRVSVNSLAGGEKGTLWRAGRALGREEPPSEKSPSRKRGRGKTMVGSQGLEMSDKDGLRAVGKGRPKKRRLMASEKTSGVSKLSEKGQPAQNGGRSRRRRKPVRGQSEDLPGLAQTPPGSDSDAPIARAFGLSARREEPTWSSFSEEGSGDGLGKRVRKPSVRLDEPQSAAQRVGFGQGLGFGAQLGFGPAGLASGSSQKDERTQAESVKGVSNSSDSGPGDGGKCTSKTIGGNGEGALANFRGMSDNTESERGQSTSEKVPGKGGTDPAPIGSNQKGSTQAPVAKDSGEVQAGLSAETKQQGGEPVTKSGVADVRGKSTAEDLDNQAREEAQTPERGPESRLAGRDSKGGPETRSPRWDIDLNLPEPSNVETHWGEGASGRMDQGAENRAQSTPQEEGGSGRLVAGEAQVKGRSLDGEGAQRELEHERFIRGRGSGAVQGGKAREGEGRVAEKPLSGGEGVTGDSGKTGVSSLLPCEQLQCLQLLP